MFLSRLPYLYDCCQNYRLKHILFVTETRSVPTSCAAAIASKLSNKPVRLTLSRDVDMTITGGRHAFLAEYEASAIVKHDTGNLKLSSLNVKLYNNGGAAADLSGPVMDRALFHLDNCYYWPEFHAVGIPCKTAQAPHTAFRGFGGPQGKFFFIYFDCILYNSFST